MISWHLFPLAFDSVKFDSLKGDLTTTVQRDDEAMSKIGQSCAYFNFKMPDLVHEKIGQSFPRGFGRI